MATKFENELKKAYDNVLNGLCPVKRHIVETMVKLNYNWGLESAEGGGGTFDLENDLMLLNMRGILSNETYLEERKKIEDRKAWLNEPCED